VTQGDDRVVERGLVGAVSPSRFSHEYFDGQEITDR
jgi:hypothetical protein